MREMHPNGCGAVSDPMDGAADAQMTRPYSAASHAPQKPSHAETAITTACRSARQGVIAQPVDNQPPALAG